MTDKVTDEFFDDEVELEAAAEGPARDVDPDHAAVPERDVAADASARRPKRTEAPADASSASTGPTPPPFWMVLVITAIALLLGVIIGYLLGSSSAMSSMMAAQEDAQAAQTTDTSSDAYALPAGHPQVEVDEDGTAHVAEGTEATE
ncbi:hypothetical protein [Collinsella sp. An307]|uniref:hypothetical protein n=1 Tax=Collinsella sp. An307 TaxID=1965630 RepID=UPI000B37BE13|nr:hypothetical protein [Collinsella sp. An307]OUO19286.1 hypothetical protein B5F89_08545 [Collinsella sp. An307]